MALPESLLDLLFYANRKQYSNKEGNVAYLDDSGLKRPFSMPVAQRAIAVVLVVVAIFIGYTIIDKTIISTYRTAEALQQSIESNLARQASIETLPPMAQVINMSDEEIIQMLADSGYNYFDGTALSDSYDLLLYKLPSDVSPEEGLSLYEQGTGSLTAEQATRLLNGSWLLGTDREYGTMVVRYVDFSTGDPEIAVQNAIDAQGIDRESMTDSGVDDPGNTYASGTLDANGTSCAWKVSAIPFSNMYSINNFPENTCYVGIRLTVQ